MDHRLQIPCAEQAFSFGRLRFTALVPDAAALRARHTGAGPAPYWARIWPAATGLCGHIAAHAEAFAGKRVLELAAGLGLPGLLAAAAGAQVTLSDIDPEAVALMRSAAAINGFQDTDCRVLDWNRIPPDLQPEILLLSDVNYEPGVFGELRAVLEHYCRAGVRVLLSSPQRLMARPFIESIRPLILEQHEVQAGGSYVSIFELGTRI